MRTILDYARHLSVIKKLKLKLKPNKALLVLELRDITCHMGSQCYLPPDTSECAQP